VKNRLRDGYCYGIVQLIDTPQQYSSPITTRTEIMSHVPQLVSRTQAYGNWLFDRDLEAADNAALAAHDRREQIERGVTFDDLMELLVELNGVQREEFMQALARGEKDDLHTIHTLLTDAKEVIVKRRLAGGE
jgi:hypothetical protein